MRIDPPLPAGSLVLLRPTASSLLGDNPILQEVQPDGSLAVLADNLETTDQELAPEMLIGSVQEVTSAPTTVDPETSPPPEATTHEAFDALPQDDKIKWLVAHFRLDSSPLLQRDSQLRKEVIRTLLQFTDVISIGGYGETNLISHAIVVEPGTTPIKMKHRPLNPVMEESLRQQIDRWLAQKVVEEADSPWSFPLVPVPKKNGKEIRWAVDYRKLNAVTKKDAFPCRTLLTTCPGCQEVASFRPRWCGSLSRRPRQTYRPREDRILVTIRSVSVCQDAFRTGQRTRYLLLSGRQSPSPPPFVRSTLLPG